LLLAFIALAIGHDINHPKEAEMPQQKLFHISSDGSSIKTTHIWADDANEARKLIENQYNPEAKTFDLREISDQQGILGVLEH